MEKREFLKRMMALSVAAVATPIISFGKINPGQNSKPKNMIKARYFEEMKALGAVKCLLCPHGCILKEGQTGICRTRTMESGTLYTKAYGNPVAVHVDPIEKKPLYHFLPASKVLSFGTAGCNFRCLNCQNDDISQVSPDEAASLDYSPEKIVQTALDLNSDGVAFTYTEPTVFFEYMFDTAALAHKAGLKTLMISNGYINSEPLKELLPVIDAFNIDLKAFDDSIYRNLCGGQLEPVLNTLKTIKESGKWLEITNLMVTGFTDDEAGFRKIIEWLNENDFNEVPLHISRFFPAFKLMDSQPTSVSAIESAYTIAKQEGIQFVYTGNLRNEAHEDTICPSCKHPLVTRSGYTAKVVGMTDDKCSECGKVIPGVWKR